MSKSNTSCSCLLLIVILLINLTLGAYCFDYALVSCFDLHVGTGWAVLGGMVTGQIAVPAAVACCIVRQTGKQVPFFR